VVMGLPPVRVRALALQSLLPKKGICRRAQTCHLRLWCRFPLPRWEETGDPGGLPDFRYLRHVTKRA
jgi:hypothetical protein